MTKWHRRFLDMAKLISSWSKDTTQVGAVIVDADNMIISTGYNGFPKNINDNYRLQNREEKLKIILHAEDNAILFTKQDITGCTIYIYPFMPCSNCAAKIIQSGIKNVISYRSDNERWQESFDISTNLFKEAGVNLILYDIDKI